MPIRIRRTHNSSATDASLRSLGISGAELDRVFNPKEFDYAAAATAETTTVTVTAEANENEASVAISPSGDADLTTPGHQVNLDDGNTTITVTVTAPNGVRRDEYRVVVTRASSLPEVSIAAGPDAVPEGTDAAFTLARTGDTSAALTVAVEVIETGATLVADVPTEVTFGAGSTTVALDVATEDDEAQEAASTVTATVSAGDGYSVAADGASASVTAEDDDFRPFVAVASPISVPENGTEVATLEARDLDTDGRTSPGRS